ncbi:MAG: tetratricopeptide repeat protein [Flavobacteriaceae bacterium]
MEPKGLNRKLTAILSADVKGYSRLMGDDDESTVTTITAYRENITKLTKKHQGRVVDTPGDNILAEFSSALNAVNCAIGIQRALEIENAKLPDDRRMEFRIGINLGDILHQDDRIYGDGVNIAARIESLAEPGGICISRGVYDQVKKKVHQGFEYLGEHAVKNIAEPVRIYRILQSPEYEGRVIGETKTKSTQIKILYGTIISLIVVASSSLIWTIYSRPVGTTAASSENRIIPLPDKPSIAVLPFVNMSEDPEQEYFSDGITNDILTALSKFGDLLIIASNTTFTYKGKSVNVENVGQELGVRYILEGSVQRAGVKVRVNAQLIDATTGYHIWSERYNRELKDIFAVQDEIVNSIVGNLAVKIDATERKRVLHKKTESLEAYDYLLQGMEYLRRRTRSDNTNARQMFEKAIKLDPEFASAYVGLGQTYRVQAEYGWTEFQTQALQKARDLALIALNKDESNADAYALLGYIETYFGQYDLAIKHLNHAIELNPNDASSYSYRGNVMLRAGRVDDAIESLETAYRFDPNMSPGQSMFLGIGYFLKGQYEKAITILEEGVSRKPDWSGNHIILAATYAQSGRKGDAKYEAQKVLQLEPFFEIDNYGTVFQNQEDRDKIIEGLRMAGLK